MIGIREEGGRFELVEFVQYILNDGDGMVHKAVTVTYSEVPTSKDLVMVELGQHVSNPAPWSTEETVNYVPFRSDEICREGIIYRNGDVATTNQNMPSLTT